MTTAHRPTYKAAIGGSEQGGNKVLVPSRQYSAKDLPGQMKMKERVDLDDIKHHDFRNELLEREKAHGTRKEVTDESTSSQLNNDRGTLEEFERTYSKKIKVSENEEKKVENAAPSAAQLFPQDMDDPNFKNESSYSSDSNSEEEEDEEKAEDDDEDELLMREYEKIKKQREEEKNRKAKEKEDEFMKQRESEILRGNPLQDAYSLKKRWYEDTAFRHQARSEPKDKKRLINDTVRSDFHKKFLAKYIMN